MYILAKNQKQLLKISWLSHLRSMECSFQVHRPESFNVNVALKQSIKNHVLLLSVLKTLESADLMSGIGFMWLAYPSSSLSACTKVS